MDVRRGLFRLWIVLTCGYVLIAGFLMYGSIKAEFDKAPSGPWTKYQKVLVEQGGRPAPMIEVQGPDGQRYQFPDDTRDETMREAMAKLYPPEKFTVEQQRALALARARLRAAEAKKPWTSLWEAIGIAAIPPLVVLIVGASLVWAFSGFKRRDA
jgi:hypothetical protein